MHIDNKVHSDYIVKVHTEKKRKRKKKYDLQII